MSERRYNEAEVAAIFERATQAPQTGLRHSTSSEGMTLEVLQEIGREVGIPAESIALAAQSLDVGAPRTSGTFLGLPLGVERTVQLDRKLSEDDWEKLVVDLRETFNARGNLRSQGGFREWTNGNLQALLEPTDKGHRVRLRTRKSDAVGMLTLGIGMFGFSAAAVSIAALQGALGDRGFLVGMGALAITGAGILLSNALRLPRWAKTRRQQMEEIAMRLKLSTSAQPTSD